MKIIIIISPEHCGAVMYDIIAMVVAIDAATAETTVRTLFVSIFALCNYLGCSIISVLLCSCLMVLQVWLASQITANRDCYHTESCTNVINMPTG